LLKETELNTRPETEPNSETAADDQVIIEEITIDGMCGVY
jgi:mycofactocin precursor